MASEIEDADLLAFHGVEGATAIGWCKETVVGEHCSLDIHFAIVPHQQADIAEGMVFAQSRGTEVCQTVPALRQAIAGGFRQVVVILLFDADKSVTIFVGYAVAIADDGQR